MRSFIRPAMLLSIPFLAALIAVPVAASTPRSGPPLADLAEIVARHAEANEVPSDLVAAVISMESNWRFNARNGSFIGLMQISPGTARALGYRGQATGLFDPETNITFGVRYLALAYRLSGGDLCQTIGRYQAGADTRKLARSSLANCARARALMASAQESISAQ